MSQISHCKIKHKSFSVVVVTGLLFRSLLIVVGLILYLLINVYVVSEEFSNVFQNGVYTIISLSLFLLCIVIIASVKLANIDETTSIKFVTMHNGM